MQNFKKHHNGQVKPQHQEKKIDPIQIPARDNDNKLK